MKQFTTNIFSTRIARPVLVLAAALFVQPLLAEPYPAAGNFQKGAKAWADNCVRCHNIRGGEELRDDQWITTMFHMRVRAGLTGQEMRDILTFLQESNSTYKPQPAATNSSKTAKGSGLSGQAIYQQTCIACHGASGEGAFPGVPDFTEKDGSLAKSDDELLKHISEGFQSPGSPMAMPAKGGNPDLNREDLKSVLGYIRQQFQ